MKCECTGKHIPKPIFHIEVWIGEDKVFLCPTSYHNMLLYIEEWRRNHGRPPGSVRKHYSAYIQDLAEARINGL